MPGEEIAGSGLIAAAVGASGLDALSTGITSAFNIHEARQNRRFARDASNTEIQRRVADLRKAGINPLMAVAGKGVGGASTPHSAAGVAEAPRMNVADKMQLMLAARLNEAQVSDLNSAANLKNVQAGDISFLQKERLLNLQAQTAQALAQKGLTDSQRAQLIIQAKLIEAQVKKLGVETATSAMQMHKEKVKKLGYELVDRQIEKLKKKGILERMGIKNPMGTLTDQFRNFQERKRKRLKQRGASGNY